MSVSIGDSYGGGKVAYILVSGDPGYVADGNQRGFIAATADLSLSKSWATAAYQSTVIGGTGTAIGTGLANSNAIVTQNGAGSTYAAGICRADTENGYSDWYLPSKNELNKLWLNRVAIGGFNAGSYYWNSSEDGATAANRQSFYDGAQAGGNAKSSLYAVRCIRSFSILPAVKPNFIPFFWA